MSHGLVQLAYIVATALFVFALHWMNAPATARHGVYAGVAGMALAVAGHLGRARGGPPRLDRAGASWPAFAVGVPLSRVPLTAVPQRTALSHAFGGLAAGLVGTAKYYLWLGEGPENLTAVPDGRDHRRDHPRLPDLHRQPHGRRQAAGGEVDPAAAGHLSAAERHQPGAARRRRRSPGVGAGAAPDGAMGAVRLSGHHRAGAALRRAADHPDRRRRHADRHRDPQRLRRALRRGDGLRAGQQAADHRRRARRLERPDPRRSSCARR